MFYSKLQFAYVILLYWRRCKMKEALREESFGAFVIGGDAMPMKPKRPCSYPGCPNLTDGRFCPEHQKQVNSNYEKYCRDKATKKRYGRAWKRHIVQMNILEKLEIPLILMEIYTSSWIMQ